MNANLKVRLFKGKTNADGTHPVQLQFYLNGKQKRKTIYTCLASDWDVKNSRVKNKTTNAAYINSVISEKFTEYERELVKVLNNETSGFDFFDSNADVSLDKAVNKELERFVSENKPMTHSRIKGYKTELFLYFNSANTLLKDINLRWFESYGAFLTNELIVAGKLVRKANIGSTAQKKVKDIKRIIEKFSNTPLSDDVRKYRIATKKPLKVKLMPAEVALIESLELKEGSLEDICRDIFLLQIYLSGCRIGALLQAYSYQFTDGRYIAAIGTGKNNVGSKLIPKAQSIVNKYLGKHERLFPLFKFEPIAKLSEFENRRRAFKHKQSCTTIVNSNLKLIAEMAGITKPLSTHIARHTFARMAIDKIKNPMITMDLLGHSSLSVHQQYLNDIRKDDVLDAAMDDIFGS